MNQELPRSPGRVHGRHFHYTRQEDDSTANTSNNIYTRQLWRRVCIGHWLIG